MPRRPLRNCRSMKRLPVTFSPFSHSIAALTSNQMSNRRISTKKVWRSSDSESAVNKISKHKLARKIEQSESSEDEELDGVVQADFVFFDPKPEDFHGVKILLKTYLDDKQWDLSGFVDLILAQTTVGTMIKIEGDEDDSPYSVITALNLGRYKDCKCIMDLKEHLLKVCQEETGVIDNLRSLLAEKADKVGLLVSQRVVNLPPQLLPPLYDALFDEVSWATEDEPTKELRDSFQFKFYLQVCKIYKLNNAGQKKKSSLKKKPGSHSDEEIIYVKPEDEIFYQLSSWSFSFPLHDQQVETIELKNYRLMGLVMAIEAEKIPTFRQQLKALIDES